MVKTLAARGPDCEFNIARLGASSSRRMARWLNSSTVREAGRCHPRVRSAGSSSGDTGGTAESTASHVGAWKPQLAGTRQPSRQLAERKLGLDVRGRGAHRPKMPSTPRRHGARRYEVQVHRSAARVGHVRQPKLASRKQYRHAARHPSNRGQQRHAQRRMLACVRARSRRGLRVHRVATRLACPVRKQLQRVRIVRAQLVMLACARRCSNGGAA